MAMTRNDQAEETRKKILGAASEEIYRKGFQATSVKEITELAGISKGCFYHHFPTKQVLGYAVLEECFLKKILDNWQPVLGSDNALASLIQMITGLANKIDAEQIKLGCPINNLAQEMSTVDEGFRTRIEKIYQSWQQEMSSALTRSQRSGHIKKDVDADAIAMLIIAVFQGAVGIAKNAQQTRVFAKYTDSLVQHLKTLAVK
jgi:AcrR family transcriptional regulator